jgi:hypothetical protein
LLQDGVRGVSGLDGVINSNALAGRGYPNIVVTLAPAIELPPALSMGSSCALQPAVSGEAVEFAAKVITLPPKLIALAKRHS